jgi:hypothetical protein
MSKYLGETPVNDLTGTPFEGYTKSEWAFEYLNEYGGIDGDHHKAWVIDQAMRILKGTPVIVKLARWEDGNEEYRTNLGEPSTEYLDHVRELEVQGYKQDEGIPP